MLPDRGGERQLIMWFALLMIMILQDDLFALLDACSFARLHGLTPIHLTIYNRHTSHSANVTIMFDLNPSGTFIMAGLQNSHLLTLLSGPEEKLSWNLILIECGQVRTAHIKVVDV
jgi:hypothetical protein